MIDTYSKALSIRTSPQPLQFFPMTFQSAAHFTCTPPLSTLNPGPSWPSRKVICHLGGEKAMQSLLKISWSSSIIFWLFFCLQVFATPCTVFIRAICIKAPNPIGNIGVHGLMGSRPILWGANSLKMVPDAAQMKIASLFVQAASTRGFQGYLIQAWWTFQMRISPRSIWYVW